MNSLPSLSSSNGVFSRLPSTVTSPMVPSHLRAQSPPFSLNAFLKESPGQSLDSVTASNSNPVEEDPTLNFDDGPTHNEPIDAPIPRPSHIVTVLFESPPPSPLHHPTVASFSSFHERASSPQGAFPQSTLPAANIHTSSLRETPSPPPTFRSLPEAHTQQSDTAQKPASPHAPANEWLKPPPVKHRRKSSSKRRPSSHSKLVIPPIPIPPNPETALEPTSDLGMLFQNFFEQQTQLMFQFGHKVLQDHKRHSVELASARQEAEHWHRLYMATKATRDIARDQVVEMKRQLKKFSGAGAGILGEEAVPDMGNDGEWSEKEVDNVVDIPIICVQDEVHGEKRWTFDQDDLDIDMEDANFEEPMGGAYLEACYDVLGYRWNADGEVFPGPVGLPVGDW